MTMNTFESLIESDLDSLYKQAWQGEKQGEKTSKIRRTLAYSLKTIAGGGSLIVATGLISGWDQLIGIAILVAVFIDSVSSNHTRLIAEVEGGYAFRALRSKVKREYNREASPLLKAISEGADYDEQKLENLKKQAHITLSDGIEEIEKKIRETDVEALKSLSLDQERAGLSTN